MFVFVWGLCMCIAYLTDVGLQLVMDFNTLWVALPSGGRDSLLAGCSYKVGEAWKTRQCTVAKAQIHDYGRVEEL